MKISKYEFNQKEPIEYLVRCKEQNSWLIQRVLKNNSFMLKKFGVSQNTQIKKLRAQGIKVSAGGISRYKNGVYKTCALTYLQIFAYYWQIPLFDMMGRDFELE